MKDCDDKFKKAFCKLYDDVLGAWKDEGNIYKSWFGLSKDAKIDKFISETDELYSDIDDLESFVSYINRIYPSLRQRDCIHEHAVRTNFLKDVMNKIIGLIKNRKEALEKDKKDKDRCKNLQLFGNGFFRVSMKDGEVVKEYISPDLIYKSPEELVKAREEKNKELYAIRITSLRDNPNKNEYSRQDISVGSIVKICDGTERFWVKVTDITSSGNYLGTISNKLICYNGYDFGDMVIFPLSEIWGIEEQKPEDTYKPGDRVFFVYQCKTYHAGGNCSPTSENYYIGTVNGWVVNQDGISTCALDNLFGVMPISGLLMTLNPKDGGQEKFIDSKDFEKSLVRCDNTKVSGHLTFYPVDEKHFQKLNSIVAKIPRDNVPNYLTGGGSWFIP